MKINKCVYSFFDKRKKSVVINHIVITKVFSGQEILNASERYTRRLFSFHLCSWQDYQDMFSVLSHKFNVLNLESNESYGAILNDMVGLPA